MNDIIFDEWAIDVTQWPTYAFVPICGNEVVLGMTIIRDRAPGPLAAVISENGQAHAQQWAADHPTWQIDYTHPEELIA